MSRFNLVLLSVVVLIIAAHPMLAAIVTMPPTFAVGNCRPKLVSFATISAAVSTVPAGSTVLVCPGTYNEQVHISQPLTLLGVSSGNSDQAVIAPPSGGLVTNASDDFGDTLAVQLWVDNAPAGPVNITNITVDGTSNSVSSCGAPLWWAS